MVSRAPWSPPAVAVDSFRFLIPRTLGATRGPSRFQRSWLLLAPFVFVFVSLGLHVSSNRIKDENCVLTRTLAGQGSVRKTRFRTVNWTCPLSGGTGHEWQLGLSPAAKSQAPPSTKHHFNKSEWVSLLMLLMAILLTATPTRLPGQHRIVDIPTSAAERKDPWASEALLSHSLFVRRLRYQAHERT